MRALVRELGAADAQALVRMWRTAGERRARIMLDEESVDVAFRRERLVVRKASAAPVDGTGRTDTDTVLDLLDGRVEVLHAILDGRLEVVGADADVARIFLAIEILLDASARAPRLQELARAFRADPAHARRGPPAGPTRRSAWYPPRPHRDEERLLQRLGLLPGAELDAWQAGWDHRDDVGRGGSS